MHSTFWLENPIVLLKDIKFIPKNTMSKEEQMNCITRLIIFLFLLMYLINYKNSFLFLILSLIFIIILYYLQKRQMTTEHYTPILSSSLSSSLSHFNKTEDLYNQGIKEYKKNRYTVEKFPSYYADQRIKSTEIIPDQSFVSANQRLTGKANPKTLIAPVVAPPSYDWEHWKDNDFVFPSAINEKRTQDFYGSGYYTSDEPVKPVSKIIENYEPKQLPSQPRQPYYENTYVTPKNPIDTLGQYNGKWPNPINNGKSMGSEVVVPKDFLRKKESRQMDSSNFSKTDGILKYTGDVNRSCTYDPTNINYNLPSNFLAGNCERNDNVKELNNELFTSTITPGVYYKTQIIEPLNSNIGISFDQQMPPRQMSMDDMGNVTYTALDPSLYEPVPYVDKTDYGTAPYEVYDPRSNGYGTSYREYQHDLTGQPRFYYDDVNTARRPNYITRTNIDHLLKADSYGTVQSTNDIMSRNCNSRQIAEQGILDNTIEHRTDLMTRTMRKKNAEMWQRRLAPLSAYRR